MSTLRRAALFAFKISLSTLCTASLIWLFVVALGTNWPTALAQQPSPSASTGPIGGSAVLPVPQPQFGGVIGRKASESTPDFPKDIAAPKGAPNVLLIMTDDTGFGAASTF